MAARRTFRNNWTIAAQIRIISRVRVRPAAGATGGGRQPTQGAYMSFLPRPVTSLFRTLVIALSLSAVAPVRADGDPREASRKPAETQLSSASDLWKRSVALVEKGEFSPATDLLSKVADSYPLMQRA